MNRWAGLGLVAALSCAAASCERKAADTPDAGTPPAPMAGDNPAQAPTAAAPVADPASCVTYDAAYEGAPLMRVRGAATERVNFLDRAEACPETGACDWKRPGYVVGGDTVFASAPVGGFHCVYTGTAKGEIVAGFLPADRLEPAAEGEPLTPDFLAGTWTYEGDNRIVFAAEGGRATARGKAVYGEEGAQNFGQFEGPMTLAGAVATYSGEGCQVTATRRGPYLVVDDNGGCGGANVSFDGIYVRAKG